MKQLIIISLLFISSLVIGSCKKQDDFLNVKRNKSDVRPSTLKDMQAILDDPDFMNYRFPNIGNAASDNAYLTDANLGILDPVGASAYLFESGDFYRGTGSLNSVDWDYPYSVIEHANIVLDGLEKISHTVSNQSQYNNVKGSALFYRSFMFYSLAQLFCKLYDGTTSNGDLGIVLRLTSDVNARSVRSTVQQTYDRIVADIKEAVHLLPITPDFPMRPGQAAANALLAKVYLSMGDYANAAIYAGNSLNQFNILLDYNSNLISSQDNPFPPYPNNPEVSFYGFGTGEGGLFCFPGFYIANVDTVLYNSYDDNDLRKSLFYSFQGSGNIFLRGGYGIDKYQSYHFSGIATDEVYLIRAESYVRTGNIPGALADLNTLLQKRYRSGTFSPITINDPDLLLAKILMERRKELPFTGQSRFEDLRRLNKDPRFAVILKRMNNGATYTLPPNDPRYVFPIPDLEIQLSGIQQNTR